MSEPSQVSHGLNLVLKLRDGIPMAEVLAGIHQVQAKIDAGLDELNFVHFARFLPTYDSKALQVITEFDGPLDPYVLDFAIEIGDVFDMLLSCTEGTEKIIPVAEHPEEFLAFVQKNNRVAVPGLPVVDDWRLYSAYRDTSVLDIVGPRKTLPQPKADREATPVQSRDVQGNVLKGYRAERATHYVLQVLDARAARAWLAARATAGAAPAELPTVTSAEIWLPGEEPMLMLNLGLTAAGMKALGIQSKWQAQFPAAFKEGALNRAPGNFDTGNNGPSHWWLGGEGDAPLIHVMASLYQRDSTGEQAFKKAAEALLDSLDAGGLKLLDSQDVEQRDRGVLGYADGIAHPRVAGRDTHVRTDLQPASTAGEFVLGAEYKNIYGGSSLGALPVGLASNGTFCAVRVLAQDAEVFHQALKSEAARLKVDPDWLAAKLMGRWFDGAPVSLHPDRLPSDPDENRRNDFDYAPSHEFPATPLDHEGLRCPVGAHIRRVNARTSRIAGARYARRLMRRGMNYTRTANGKTEKGLFGLFICADLERQFEFVQRHWINGDRFAEGARGCRDPFAGTPEGGVHDFSIPMRAGEALKVRLPQFVFTRGSVYLFMPGLHALRTLDRFADISPPVGQAAIPVAQPNPQPRVPDMSSQPSTAAPPLVFDTTQREFQINPYPEFAKFRRLAPVFEAPKPFDGWFIFGYDDVLRVCKEDVGPTANFSAAAVGSDNQRGMFQLDEPPHDEVRNVVASAWVKVVSRAPELVKRSIGTVLAQIGAWDAFDLVDDFARPVPRNVYFDLLGGDGIPPSARAELDELARTVMKYHDHALTEEQKQPGTYAGKALFGKLGALLDAAGSNPAFEGSFLANLAPHVSRGAFTKFVACKTLVSTTVAGYMSVEFLLATGVRRLLLDDAFWWQRVQREPGLLGPCVAEMLRCEHALSVIDRFALRDVRIGNQTIPKGAKVFAVLASANRDERVYGDDADEFNPLRQLPRPHLGLGYGTHACMGRYLQSVIAEPAISALMAAKPKLRLPPDAQPSWFRNFYFRSFDHLEVKTT